MLRWNDEWVQVVALSANALVLATGEGVSWRRDPSLPLEISAAPDSRVRLRYTCPVRDPEGTLVPMAWRPGGVVRLAQDMGHPEIAEAIRRST